MSLTVSVSIHNEQLFSMSTTQVYSDVGVLVFDNILIEYYVLIFPFVFVFVRLRG